MYRQLPATVDASSGGVKEVMGQILQFMGNFMQSQQQGIPDGRVRGIGNRSVPPALLDDVSSSLRRWPDVCGTEQFAPESHQLMNVESNRFGGVPSSPGPECSGEASRDTNTTTARTTTRPECQ